MSLHFTELLQNQSCSSAKVLPERETTIHTGKISFRKPDCSYLLISFVKFHFSPQNCVQLTTLIHFLSSLPHALLFLSFFLAGVQPVSTQLVAPAANVSDPGVPCQDPNIADRYQLQVLLGFLTKSLEKYPNKDMFYNKVRVSFPGLIGKKKIFSSLRIFSYKSCTKSHLYTATTQWFFSNLVTLQPALLVAMGRRLQLEDLDEKGSQGSVITACNP